MALVQLVTVAEVRAEGLSVASADDGRVTMAIELASEYVERCCGIPFHQVTRGTLDPLLVDGSGTQRLALNWPIRSISEAGVVDANGVRTAYQATSYVVYSRAGQDERNPKVVLRYGDWPEGMLNVYLLGVFGWVESDGATVPVLRAPLQVRRAVIGLVVNDFAWRLADEDRQGDRLRRWITSETTEGHTYSLDNLAGSSGPSGIRWIDQILRAFRRPRGVVC